MTDLVVSGLAVDLGGRPVLRDVEFRASSGQFIGLVGPNGAGKTTFLRSVLGLVKAQGSVSVDGRRGSAASRLMGYVPQRHEFAWDFPITIEDAVLTGRIGQIGWFRRPGRADYAAAYAALRRVELLDLAERPIGQLSGGQRQRVLIARALAAEAPILLLDEPFTGVDMPTQELLTGLLRRLTDEGQLVVMTTHDLPAAMVTCDRICLINGTIRADGAPAELRDTAVWMDVFGMSARSPLLATLGLTPPDAGAERESMTTPTSEPATRKPIPAATQDPRAAEAVAC